MIPITRNSVCDFVLQWQTWAVLLLGVYTRWVSIYTIPMMLGATHFWTVRKGFYFTEAGWELPFVWAIMLAVQALLGDGAFAVKVPSLPWERRRHEAAA